MKRCITRVATAIALVAAMLTEVVISAPVARATTSVVPKKIVFIVMENQSYGKPVVFDGDEGQLPVSL